MTDSLDDLRIGTTERLREFGQYLVMARAEPGEQRFGAPDVVAASLAVIVWALGKYVGTFLSEAGKLRAADGHRPAALEHRVTELESHVRSLHTRELERDSGVLAREAIGPASKVRTSPPRSSTTGESRLPFGHGNDVTERLLRDLIRELQVANDFVVTFALDRDELRIELIRLGLTHRAAMAAVEQLAPYLEQQLRTMLEKGA
jgi:hypothetical protein